MRTWGRRNNTGTWYEIQTDAKGFNDLIYLTTLAQVLFLNIGESPFYANYGIPGEQSVLTQIFPDFFVAQTQQQFSQYFASLIISKEPPTRAKPDPTYDIRVVTHQGVILDATVPISI